MAEKAKHRWLDPVFASKVLKRLKPNMAEQRLLSLLDDLYPGDWRFVGDGQVILGGLNPDFINCNGKKLIIELFGAHWHQDITGPRSETGRADAFRAFGYKTLIVWEKELGHKSLLITKIRRFHE